MLLDGSRITRATGLKRPRRAAAQVCRRNIVGFPISHGGSPSALDGLWFIYCTLFHGRSEHKMDDNCKAILGNLHLPFGRWPHWKIRDFNGKDWDFTDLRPYCSCLEMAWIPNWVQDVSKGMTDLPSFWKDEIYRVCYEHSFQRYANDFVFFLEHWQIWHDLTVKECDVTRMTGMNTQLAAIGD